MERIAFKMILKPGCENDYKKRHDEIWPEMVELIKKSGIYDYSIFWDKQTNILFAYLLKDSKMPDLENGSNPVVRKWWNYMSELMEVNPDNSAVEFPLIEVFHLD